MQVGNGWDNLLQAAPLLLACLSYNPCCLKLAAFLFFLLHYWPHLVDPASIAICSEVPGRRKPPFPVLEIICFCF